MPEPRNKRLRQDPLSNYIRGAASAMLGLPGDIASMMEGGSVIPEVDQQIREEGLSKYNTEYFGEKFGADTDSTAFFVGSILSPENLPAMTKGVALGISKATLFGITGIRRLARGNTEYRTVLRNLGSAQNMLADGASNRTVYEKTGWYLDDTDGQWKFQIPHWERATVNHELLNQAGNRNFLKLGEIVDYPDLFEAYPQLENLPVSSRIHSRLMNPQGSASLNKGVNIDANFEDYSAVLMHEIEHLVQEIEGFAPGGTPFVPKDGAYLDDLTIRTQTSADELAEVQQRLDIMQLLWDAPDDIKYSMKGIDETIAYLKEQGFENPRPDAVALIRALHNVHRNEPEKILDAWDTMELQKSIRTQRLMLFEDLQRQIYNDPQYADLTKARDLVQDAYFESYRNLAGEAWARTAQDLQYQYEMGMLDIMEPAPYPADALDDVLARENLKREPQLSRETLTLMDYLNPQTEQNYIERAKWIAENRARNIENMVAPDGTPPTGAGVTSDAFLYHGSPHDIRDRFSLQKIGTGEGAQAYGWGLYFAEGRGTAKWYALNLAPDPDIPPLRRDVITTWVNDVERNMDTFNLRLKDAESDVAYFRKAVDDIDTTSPDFEPEELTDAVDTLADAEEFYQEMLKFKNELDTGVVDPATVDIPRTKGYVYQVEVPDNEISKMLLWDEPLESQSPHIQQLGRSYLLGDNSGPYDMMGYTGKDLYEFIAGSQGPEAASKLLLEEGIPGIRYLDRASRSKGTGNRNMVLFDDSIVEIKTRREVTR